MSFDVGPKIASIASRLSDLAASTSALAASPGEANIFCTGCAWVAAGFSCLLQELTPRIITPSADSTDHRRTLAIAVAMPPLLNLLAAFSIFQRYLRKPPPLNRPPPPRPPPHPPPPPRLLQPRELDERSAQPPLPKLEP